MKTALTPQQITSYQSAGWLMVDDFLNPQELEVLDLAVTQGIEAMGTSKFTGEGNDSIVDSPDDFYYRVFLQRLNLWRISADVHACLLAPQLGQMLCTLAGIDGIRVWHDQTLQKLAWGNPTSWHMDVPNWSFHSPNAISIWIALDDATIQNGCMYYLPGSHKVADYKRKGGFDPNIGTIFSEYPELETVEPVPVTLKAGSAAFHNGLMAHAAGPNMTPYPRRAMTCAYMPDGATFNGIQNILSDAQIARLNVGDVLDDESQTPLVWSQQMASA